MRLRMRSLIRSTVSLGTVLVLVGCDDFLGIGDDVDADVIAEVRQAEDFIGYTIKNRGPDTVFFGVSPYELEHRERGEWKQVLYKDGVYFIDVLQTFPIVPGRDHKVGGPISETDIRPALTPGAYRYNLWLSEDHNMNQSLPDQARISNTVRIK